MTNQTAKNENMKIVWVNALKTFGKILVGAVVCFCFFTMSLFYLSPISAAKMFGFLNLKRAQESCYEFAYSKDKSTANLYNLVLFEIEMEKPEVELYYLNLLLSDEGYNDFCTKLDDSSLKEVSNKSLVAYSCNTNSFLLNQKVKCMYNLKISDSAINKFVKSKLSSNDMAECTFATYVDLIIGDSSLSETRKTNLLNSLLSEEALANLDAKIESLRAQAKEQTGNKRLVIQNALVSNCRGKYLAYEKCFGKDNEKTELAKEEYLAEYEIYKSLIKN